MIFDAKEVLTQNVTVFSESATVRLWNRVKGFFVDAISHEEINLGYAYESYLNNTCEKYRKIKTLIYRHTPKDLYDFYECIGVSNSGKTILTDSINNLLRVSNKIIITGTGGIGKTILLKHLFLNTVDTTNRIPVLVELRGLNSLEIKDISLYQVIFNTLSANGFCMEEKYFEYSMKKGAYIILLDGYDEINRDKEQKVSSEVLELSSKYLENSYIISSRPSDVFIGWHEFTEMQAKNMSKEQALSLISKIDFEEVVKERFYRELDERLYDKYTSFASNPLLLTIMLLTFDSRASIPDNLNDFYEQAFATLFNMHDATKDSYVRDIRSGLGCEDFKLVFAYLCFKSYFRGRYEFSESSLNQYILECREKFPLLQFVPGDFKDDLVSSVCMLVKEGIDYRFSHRSFQEYFAAWYTCKLTDDVQVRLLTNWMKESDSSITDFYFDMLFNLQSEKVNKVILRPALMEIKKKYKDNKLSIGFLDELFSGISIISTRRGKSGAASRRLSLNIKNRWLCNVLILTCRLNRYPYPKKKPQNEIELANTLSEGCESRELSIDEALKIVTEETFLEGLRWFDRQVKFALEILEKCESNTIGNKRKVLSILEEL